jgi:hypothetical protein
MNSASARTSLVRSAAAAALLALGTLGTAQAGYVTTNEGVMDAIFGQSIFGANPIDIRFNAEQTIHNSALLTIDSDAEFDLLATYEVGTPTVSMFYVDSISFCGSFGEGIVGCGSTPGSLIALDSDFTASEFGGNAEGHELGHNLSLQHVAGTDTNLMNPSVYEGQAPAPLTQDQLDAIFQSPLVQHDAQGYYISVTPYAVVASIPEPSSVVLMGLGMALAGIVAVRKRSAR